MFATPELADCGTASYTPPPPPLTPDSVEGGGRRFRAGVGATVLQPDLSPQCSSGDSPQRTLLLCLVRAWDRPVGSAVIEARPGGGRWSRHPESSVRACGNRKTRGVREGLSCWNADLCDLPLSTSVRVGPHKRESEVGWGCPHWEKDPVVALRCILRACPPVTSPHPLGSRRVGREKRGEDLPLCCSRLSAPLQSQEETGGQAAGTRSRAPPAMASPRTEEHALPFPETRAPPSRPKC